MKKYLLCLILIMFISSCKKDAPAPVANFTFIGDNKPSPCIVTFSNSSINALSYSWEFGDGATLSQQNPKHSYTTGGTFTVKLTATGDGGSNSITKSLTIQNPVPEPVANFTTAGDNNFAPCKVTLTNSSTNSVSYNWDFGDGQTSTTQSPAHVYANGGTFNVTLTAINSIGTQNLINKIVTILNKPTKLRINSIVLTNFPATQSNGSSWDSGSGPDIYIKFTDANNTNYFTSSYFLDVIKSQLPLTYSTVEGFPMTITTLNFKYSIVLYDKNSVLADTWMGGYYFTASESMPVDGSIYPTTIPFSSLSEIAFTLNVTWLP